jgi:transcriptional regulator with XRE-family HTH domain
MVNVLLDHPLRKWRKAKGLTLEQAADEVGAVRQMWSDWERRRRRPGPTFMIEIFRLTDGQVVPNDFYDLPVLQPRRKAA